MTLERQEARAVRQTEVFSGTRQRFVALLKELESIDEGTWPDQTFREELSRALAVTENARQEFNKAMATVETAGGEPLPVAEVALPGRSLLAPEQVGSFRFWVKVGFAAMLPLGVLIVLVGVIAAWIARGH